MSCINQVVLVGRLLKDPAFAETQQHKRYARLSVETEKFMRFNGESKRVAVVHNVVCYNQFSLPPLEQSARAGCFVKVIGELGTARDGKAEIIVSQYSGEVGLMGFPSAPAAPSAAPAAQPQAPAPQAGAGQPAQRSVATGGLGRLKSRTPPQDDFEGPGSHSQAPPKAPGGAPAYDPYDDIIPF